MEQSSKKGAHVVHLAARTDVVESESVARRNEIPDIVANIDKLKKFTNCSLQIDPEYSVRHRN